MSLRRPQLAKTLMRNYVTSDFPWSVRIENTNACNARCVMCPREKMDRSQGVMPLGQFKRLVDECALHHVWSMDLHGFGEPLLDRELPAKVAYAKQKKIRNTYLITNLSKLTEKLSEELVHAGLDSIGLSFFGDTPESHDTIQAGLDYQECLENMRALIRVKARLKSSRPAIRIKFYKEHVAPKLVREFQDYAKLRFLQWHNWSYGRQYNATVDGQDRACRLVLEPIMQVLWNGNVVPCSIDFDGKMVLGNVFETSVHAVWNGQRYRDFRRLHAENRFPELCQKCDYLKPYEFKNRVKFSANLIKRFLLNHFMKRSRSSSEK